MTSTPTPRHHRTSEPRHPGGAEPDGPRADALDPVPASTGRRLDLRQVLGKVPVLLVFVDTLDGPAAQMTLAELDGALAGFGRRRVQLVIVTSDAADGVIDLREREHVNVLVVSDADAELRDEYAGTERSGDPLAVLIGLDGRPGERRRLDPSRGESAATVLTRWLDELQTADPTNLNVRPSAAQQRIGAGAATAEPASGLGTPPSTAAMTTRELEDEDGNAYRLAQGPSGRASIGGGEYPDPATPPRSPAPGSARSA